MDGRYRVDVWCATAQCSFLRKAILVSALFVPGIALADFAVSDSGSPVYTLGIQVPPGVAGMSPKIGLSYTGGGINGPLGYGWSIQGVSSITRCPAIKAIDGFKGSVAFVASDKLCMDGQRLIQTDGSGAVVNGAVQNPSVANPFQGNDSLGIAASGTPREYRTEKDSYARIRAYGYANNDTSGASGPAYFKVWTKSGQIFEYGASPSALVSPYGKSIVAVWAVSRISDTLGNFIDFKYEQRDIGWGTGGTVNSPTLGREWNLAEIQYSGNKVIFNYIDRPISSGLPHDRAEAWHLGSKNISIRRLQSITTYINSPNTTSLGPGSTAVPVKTIQLGYSIGAISGRSGVSSIKECAGDAGSNKCLPPTYFNYSAGSSDAYAPNGAFASSSLATEPMTSASGNYGVLTVDFNGDGKTDLLRWSDTPAQNKLFLSNGDGSFQQATNFTLTGTNDTLYKSDGCFTTVVADINGDGLPDLLRYSAALSINSGASCPSPPPLAIYRNNGDGSFTNLPYNGPVLERRASTPTACIKPEITGCTHPGWTRGATFYVIDVDGDGIPDIVKSGLPAYSTSDDSGDPLCNSCTQIYKGNGLGTFNAITTNLANISVYNDPRMGAPMNDPRNLVDIDGDGMLDFVGLRIRAAAGTTSSAYRSRGDGNFDAAAAGVACTYPLDFNGDGSTDCLSPDANGAPANNALKVATGAATSLQPVASFNLTGTGQQLTATDTGILAIDINGDGRTDILRWSDDTTKNKLYLSNGDGTFTESGTFNLKDASTTDNQLKKSDGSFDFVAGDFTGRGAVELLRVASGVTTSSPAASRNRLFTKATSSPPDQLANFGTSTSPATTLSYVPLSNSATTSALGSYGVRYVSDRGTVNAAVSPTLDVNFPMYVVSNITSLSYSGNGLVTSTTEYSYKGLKVDAAGRGLLGFREVRRQTPGPDPGGSPVTVITQYLQSHPYIGAIARTDTRNGQLENNSAQLLSSSVNAYCDLSAANGADATAIGKAQSGQANAFCPVSAKVQRPYLLWSRGTGNDLTGAALPSVTTQNSYLSSGDPSSIVVTTVGNVAAGSRTYTQTTTNQYLPDNTGGDNWILGRLSTANVQNTVPNLLASLSTSAGNAANASATRGNSTPPPISPAVLMPILQLLLED